LTGSTFLTFVVIFKSYFGALGTLKVNSHFSSHRNSVILHRFYKGAFIALKIEEKVKIVVPVKTYAYPKTCQYGNMPNHFSFHNFSLVCIFLQNGRCYPKTFNFISIKLISDTNFFAPTYYIDKILHSSSVE
jgi:hypothetical protein